MLYHTPVPIRVLQLLVTTSVGGGPKQVYDLVRHLPREEFQIAIAAPRGSVDQATHAASDRVGAPTLNLRPGCFISFDRFRRSVAARETMK